MIFRKTFKALPRAALTASSSAALLCLVSAPSEAAILSSTATNIDVNGTSYDFTFHYGDGGTWTSFNDVQSFVAPFEFITLAAAQEAQEAIVEAVDPQVFDPIGFYPEEDLIRTFRIPYSTEFGIVRPRDVYYVSYQFNYDPFLEASNGDDKVIEFVPFPGSWVSATLSANQPAAAVPTPALLPGLLGMGIATLRKRKLASSSQA